MVVATPDRAKRSPKRPFYFHMETTSTPMKLLFASTSSPPACMETQTSELLLKLLFPKHVDPTKHPSSTAQHSRDN
jgi:hypothetical protein